MVDGSIFSEPQGPVACEKGEQRRPAERQQAVMENTPAPEPVAHRLDGTPQEGKRWPRGIQTAKPAAQRGGIGHALGIFDHRRRLFHRTAFQEATPQRLAASDQAVVGVRGREGRQEGEGLVARFTTAAPHPNPIVFLVMSLLAAAAVANDRMAPTQGALARDTPSLGPIGLEVVLRFRK